MTSPMPVNSTPVSSPDSKSVEGADTTSNAANAASTANGGRKTVFKSLEDLRKAEPKLYHDILQGLAMAITSDMRHHQDELKRLNRQLNHP